MPQIGITPSHLIFRALHASQARLTLRRRRRASFCRTSASSASSACSAWLAGNCSPISGSPLMVTVGIVDSLSALINCKELGASMVHDSYIAARYGGIAPDRPYVRLGMFSRMGKPGEQAALHDLLFGPHQHQHVGIDPRVKCWPNNTGQPAGRRRSGYKESKGLSFLSCASPESEFRKHHQWPPSKSKKTFHPRFMFRRSTAQSSQTLHLSSSSTSMACLWYHNQVTTKMTRWYGVNIYWRRVSELIT